MKISKNIITVIVEKINDTTSKTTINVNDDLCYKNETTSPYHISNNEIVETFSRLLVELSAEDGLV